MAVSLQAQKWGLNRDKDSGLEVIRLMRIVRPPHQTNQDIDAGKCGQGDCPCWDPCGHVQFRRAYMPDGMLQLGHAMHTRARDLSLTLRDASITGDTNSTLNALGAVTETCVSCHRAHRSVVAP